MPVVPVMEQQPESARPEQQKLIDDDDNHAVTSEDIGLKWHKVSGISSERLYNYICE